MTLRLRSPSLRGSGLKFSNKVIVKKGLTVSLFTREWIEIDLMQLRVKQYNVSLFTREWIEIKTHNGQERQERVSLFTREWIEIYQITHDAISYQSPSLRGSGLKWQQLNKLNRWHLSPSLRGSGLKYQLRSLH